MSCHHSCSKASQRRTADSSIVQRFLLDLPLRLLVLLLGRLLSLLRSTATTEAPMLKTSDKTSSSELALPASCTLWPRSVPRSTRWHALRCRQKFVASATIASPSALQLPPLPTSTLCGSLSKAASLAATCASQQVPFLLEMSFAASHAQESDSECDTCCKVLQLLKLYEADMDSLLPQHPSSCQKGLGHVLPVRLPTINVWERLTLTAVVPRFCSIKVS